MKAITTRSGVAYEGPSIPANPSLKRVVKREIEETTDKEQSNFQGSAAQIPPPVIPISIPEPDVPKTLPKTTFIPEPDVPNTLPKTTFILEPDEKLLELVKIPLNENCSAMLLKKILEKLGDPGKFLIPCNFPGMDDSFKKFTDEPALVCVPPSKDDNDEKEKQEVKNLTKSTAKRQTRITPCLKNFKVIQKESIFHSNKTPQVSSVFAITSTLPTIEPKDSLIMGDKHLSTFRVEEIVPIPRRKNLRKFLIESISMDLEFFDDSYATKAKKWFTDSLEDHLDAQERKQDKSTLETPVDFEEEILDADVQENEVIPLYDE
ncbi:hypothetical protein Tco_0026828 [Tanacetum coccineum]